MNRAPTVAWGCTIEGAPAEGLWRLRGAQTEVCATELLTITGPLPCFLQTLQTIGFMDLASHLESVVS